MTVLTKTLNEPVFCKKEILRYAGCKEITENVNELIHSCINEVRPYLAYRVCYCELELKISGNICDFGLFSVESSALARSFEGKEKIVLFGATAGTEIDRLIVKYGRLSPSRALMIQAIGAERIEALCDSFCEKIGCGIRFSPGYGDLSLEVQKKIFDILDCSKRIGLTLNDSLLMSPSKSVTAFAVYGKKTKNKCSSCNKTDCAYRGVI